MLRALHAIPPDVMQELIIRCIQVPLLGLLCKHASFVILSLTVIEGDDDTQSAVIKDLHFSRNMWSKCEHCFTCLDIPGTLREKSLFLFQVARPLRPEAEILGWKSVVSFLHPLLERERERDS